jgi:hypothetical protein
MDTMTYATVAASGEHAAEKNDQQSVYYPEKKLIRVQHFLQSSSLIISKHRCRCYGWCVGLR